MSRGQQSTICCITACWLALALIITSGVCAFAEPAGMDDLAGPLKAFARNAENGISPAAVSQTAGVKVVGGRVLVEVYFTSPAAAAATGFEQYGGTVQIRRENRVQALMPVNRLADLAALPQVAQVRPTGALLPLQGFGTAISQGVQLTNANSMHIAGFRGQGVRVAIIDIGFAGLTAAEVPVDPTDPTQVVSFRADGGFQASNHGTAVAEVVADMAPGCSMTLIAVDTPMSVEQAIDYVVAQGFRIAVMALGIVEGPFDETSALSRSVNRARNAGVFWVNSAGNFAQRHYEGLFEDRNNNGRHEFTRGGKETIEVNLGTGTFEAWLSWYETAGPTTNRDYDLLLLDETGAEIARSAYTQNGDDPPMDRLSARITTAGVYYLVIERVSPSFSADPTRDMLKLFVPELILKTRSVCRHAVSRSQRMQPVHSQLGPQAL